MSASAAGQFMIADVPRVVDHEMPLIAIDHGQANGWDLLKPAPPFRCRFIKGKFVAIEE